jgi:hypothetical protein
MSQEAKSLPHRYAALKKKTADLVDHSCTIADEARPNAMERLEISRACTHKSVGIDAGIATSAFRPILLQKSFAGDERNFLGPLMRFALRDVRDHIACQKNDHGPSYRPRWALQR